MLRVIFDTNVYGKLIEETNFQNVSSQILNDPEFKVYGFTPIRKELRNTPRSIKLGKLSKRNLLLGLYDEVTGGRYLRDSLKIHKLALKFYNSYREHGGIYSWSKSNIDVDFTIVACASVYSLNIVVSNDQKTMLSKPARKAYKQVCIKESLWEPQFWSLSDLKSRYNF